MARIKSFEKRAKEFKDEVLKLQEKYSVELSAGYLNPAHDDNNLIIDDKKSNDGVYFDTLTKEEW